MAQDQKRSRGSQDFIGMVNFSGRDVDSFHFVDENSSRLLSSEGSEVQGRDLSQPEVTRVQVRAHQRTLHDGRVVNVRSHSRGKGKGRTITFSPERVTHHKGGLKGRGKVKQARKENHWICQCNWQSKCHVAKRSSLFWHWSWDLSWAEPQDQRLHIWVQETVRTGSVSAVHSQELRLEHTGEENQINQCGQCHGAHLGSKDSAQNQDGQCSQCLQDHFGSISKQIMDGQCSQCGEEFGSILGQNQDGQCSHCQLLQESRLGHTGEENQINQCSQCPCLQEFRLGHTGDEDS
eukprot:4048427-Amphidinium_carterae.3